MHTQGDPCISVDLRHWADLATAMTLFFERDIKVQELVFNGNPEADSRLLQFASRLFADSLVSINLAGCKGIDYSALPFLNAMSNLHTLDIGGNLYITDNDMEKFLDYDMKQLQHIAFSGCSCLTDRTLLAVSRQNNRVLSVDASCNSNFTHIGTNAIVLHCENLKALDLSNCSKVTFSGVVMEAGASLFGKEVLFQYAGRSLTKIKLDNNVDVQIESLDWICGALPDLEEVSLPRVKNLSDANVQGLAYGCLKLTKLRIQGCKNVKSEALRALGLKSTCLTELNIASIGRLQASAVRELLINCTTLKFINISRNKGVSDSVFSELEYRKGKPIFLPNLRRISVALTSLTAFGIACLAERCRNLEHMDVSGHQYHTDAAMLVIASCCTKLKSFWANDCPAVTDRGARAICYACKKLEVLHLSSSVRDTDAWGGRTRQFTDFLVEAVLGGSRCLRELSLRNQCDIHMSSQWIQNSFKARGGHQFLEKIDLRGVDELKLDHIAHVFRSCTELCYVLLSDNDALPGVSSSDFWHSAFSGSMYTVAFSGDSVEIDFEVEHGRYCDDDGTASFVTFSAVPSGLDAGGSLTSLETFKTAKSSKSKQQGTAISLAEYSTDTLGKTPALPPGCLVLSGHPSRKSLRFRDQYYRRRHDELHAIRLIQLKYRIHAIWQRFRYRISARKIANTYKVLLQYRKLMAKVREMQIYYSARKIQRYFKNCMLPYLKAATQIQKIYRGHFAKKRVRILIRGQRSATLIQKVARGMLVRISERYILAQIYLKLPPFWRIIMNMAPPVNAAEEATRKRIFSYQVSDLTKDTQNMITHIINDVTNEGVLAPQLPLYVPQAFDKKPYVSVDDGRKIAYYGHREGLLWNDTEKTTERMVAKLARRRKQLQYDENGNDVAKLAERKARESGTKVEGQGFLSSLVDGFERVPIHQFNVTFWPHTAPIQFDDPSTEQHDPMLNGFDVAQNTREVLYCEVCRTRMRIVHCKTCQKGYCFFCAFRVHTELARRNHQMEMMEPRVIKIKEVSKSLVYHVDMAKQASYDLKYLVKYMRSATEVKRLQAEAKLARDFEQQEDARRMVFLRAQSESNDKHQAATEISLLYRCLKARRVVREKKMQIALESAASQNAKFANVVTPLQKRFRLYSTRTWFASKGQVFKLNRLRPKKRRIKQKGDPPAIPFVEVMSRVEYETQQRRVNARTAQFDKLLGLYGTCLTFLDVNISHWKEQDQLMPPIVTKLEQVKNTRSAEHEAESQTTAALKGVTPPDEYERMEKALDALWIRVEIAQQRMANVTNIRWWIAQHLRSSFRRREIVQARFLDTIKRLEWVVIENSLVRRIESQLKCRVELFRTRLGMGLATEWLNRYSEFIAKHVATLDAQQETIILEEINRLDRDSHAALEFDSLTEELYQGLLAENRLLAEKVNLEFRQRSGKLEPGSTEAVQVSEQLVLVRRKQTQLANSVLDTLKLGLQNKFNEEEDRYTTLYAFPGDDVQLPVERYDEIKTELIDQYKAPHHIKIHDVLQVYFVQPWLAEQAVADVRLEELIAAKEIDKGKVEEEKKGTLTKIADNDAKTIENRRKIIEINNEISIRSTAEVDENEIEEERQERAQLIATMQGEVFKMESEVEVMDTVNIKFRETVVPLEKKIEAMVQDIDDHQRMLVARQTERERLASLFFKTEKEIQHELILDCGKQQHIIEKEMTASQKQMAIFKAGASSSEFIQRVIVGEVSIIERNTLKIPLGTKLFELQTCLHIVKPRTYASADNLVRRLSEGRMIAGQSTIDCLTRMKHLLDVEEQEMDEFPRRVPMYEKALMLFAEQLLAQRRQKSMQKELVLRKKRLSELREMRMRQMREVKEKEEEEIKAKNDEREEARRNHVPLAKRIAKVTKQAVRDAKDLMIELKHAAGTHMDPEELRMAHTIRSKNPDGDTLKPEGIRKLYFTHGKENTDSFAAQQLSLEEKGVPFYKRMERTIGNQLFIWTQMTFDNKLMLTNLELGHKVQGHPQYKDPEKMAAEKWVGVTDDSTNLIVWVKADITKLRAIKEFQVSMSEIEENRNLVDNYELIEPNLSEFDLPDISLWWKRIEKIKYSSSETTNDIINEVIKTRALLKKNPADRNMQALVGRLNDKLRAAYDKEKKLLVTDPLKAAVDMMVLTAPELEKWMDIFGSLDKKKEGLVAFDPIFEFLEETPTAYAKEIFFSVDAVDYNGMVEFGDYVRAISTYSMFGKEDVLKFMFVFADKDKAGVITHAQFVTLLNTLNPFDKRRAKRALQELQMIPDKEMKFKEFATLNDEFPNIMHPAFQLQDAMRKKHFGVDWWFDKLVKYKGVRRKMQQSGANVDLMAEIQMKRFEDDVAKEKRMKERALDIHRETNGIRKALLEARQFVDEFT